MARSTKARDQGRSIIRRLAQEMNARPKTFLVLLCLCFYLPGLTTLPPLDRDESRFAQASKQMLETGDFIEIRFQDRARNKKPVGIYWMQAASAWAFGGPAEANIWAYRLPSMLGAILSVLAVYWIANRALAPPGALLAGGLMASMLLLVGEANIAKTDAALLMSTLLAQISALYLYLERTKAAASTWAPALVFWAALGLGTLVKGPVILMIVGLTLIAVCVADRQAKWLLRLMPLLGLSLFLAIVLPWGIAVWQATDGAFFAQAVGEDFAPKLLSGQESHGAPPGYYILAASLTLWPAALFLLPSLRMAWQNRTDPLIRFSLAWILPSWLVFELIPTKLPHYILPLYPALILIIAWSLSKAASNNQTFSLGLTRASLAIWIVLSLILSAGIFILPITNGGQAGFVLYVLSALCVGLILWTAQSMWRENYTKSAILAVLTGLAFTVGLLEGSARQINDLNVSPRIARLLEISSGSNLPPLASAGYTEPSLVFLTRTDIRLGKGAGTAQFLIDTPGAIAIVEEREQTTFLSHLSTQGFAAQPFAVVEGVNYSRGDKVTITLYRLSPTRIR